MPVTPSRYSRGPLALACAGLFAVTACSHPGHPAAGNASPQAQDNDPFEPFNRAVYRFNSVVDGVILKPVSTIYRGVVPDQGREMVSHFLQNLYAPVVFADSVLQGDPQNSFATFWRFTLNTTLGIGGMFDFASEAGLKNRSADLGETFAMYGADSGPYVMLPIIGPSNMRDAFGRLGDAFLDPFNYISNDTSAVIWTATAIDKRTTNAKLIDDVNSSSLDPYATFRSGYEQRRAEEIRRAIAARDKALENSACK